MPHSTPAARRAYERAYYERNCERIRTRRALWREANRTRLQAIWRAAYERRKLREAEALCRPADLSARFDGVTMRSRFAG